MKCLVNHRLAPYFKECFSGDLLKSEYFVVSFDESLNATVQECEIDLRVRYWDSIKNRVQVRYWDSMFFGHGTHADLLKNFYEGVSGLSMSKLVQISMDGPSVNWKFMKAVVAKREQAELPRLIDTGTHFVFS